MNTPEQILLRWQAAWPTALASWSKYTRLRDPLFCLKAEQAGREGLTGSFAMIRLQDQAIVVSLPEVLKCGVEDYAVEVLAHEIGHHVLAPSTLTNHFRVLARMRWALPTIEGQAPMVANLYTDLLINDRLQRSAELRLADVYIKLGQDKEASSKVWALYTRIYEILWRLAPGALRGGPVNDAMNGDAWLGSRIIRSFARDWIEGSGRFAALLLPYLLEDAAADARLQKWFDTQNAGRGGNPGGLIDEEASERTGAIHPAQDPILAGDEEESPGESQKGAARSAEAKPIARSAGQAREPFQYGEILRSAGLTLTDHEIAVRYYRERARPHLIRFPVRPAPTEVDPLMEGLEPWNIGDALDTADWLQSILQSPRVIPGVTTVQRVWGTSPGNDPRPKPLDLDLYIDSSGSMPNPQNVTSYLTLAGAIIALSALRAGAHVQATLWSGTRQFESTEGFVRDEEKILQVITGFFGGGTAFPIHVLRETYWKRRPDAPPAHIMVISDEGVTTMFADDEIGGTGWDVAKMALPRAGGGASLVLNLPEGWEQNKGWNEIATDLTRAQREGFKLHTVSTWADLERLAREFSAQTYATLENAPTPVPVAEGPA